MVATARFRFATPQRACDNVRLLPHPNRVVRRRIRHKQPAGPLGDTWEAPAGPFAENLVVHPDKVTLSNPNDFTTDEFAILSRGVETTYAVSLESNGKRALVESSKIPADTTHVKSQVLSQRLRSWRSNWASSTFPRPRRSIRISAPHPQP